MPIYFTVLAINIYVLCVVYKNKELHSLDYFLVTYQSIVDLIFTGVLGCLDYFLDLWYTLFAFCVYGGFLEIVQEYIP